ncbi:hypothetical protein IAT40_001664 [Kwoniella sp. CBS 6097]
MSNASAIELDDITHTLSISTSPSSFDRASNVRTSDKGRARVSSEADGVGTLPQNLPSLFDVQTRKHSNSLGLDHDECNSSARRGHSPSHRSPVIPASVLLTAPSAGSLGTNEAEADVTVGGENGGPYDLYLREFHQAGLVGTENQRGSPLQNTDEFIDLESALHTTATPVVENDIEAGSERLQPSENDTAISGSTRTRAESSSARRRCRLTTANGTAALVVTVWTGFWIGGGCAWYYGDLGNSTTSVNTQNGQTGFGTQTGITPTYAPQPTDVQDDDDCYVWEQC